MAKKKKKQDDYSVVKGRVVSNSIAPTKDDYVASNGKATLNKSAVAPIKSYASSTKKKKEEEESNIDFFRSGAFGRKDKNAVEKSVLGIGGTLLDATAKVARGVLEPVEGVADWMRHGVADTLDFFGADETAKTWRDVANKSDMDSLFGWTDDYFERNSMLGKTSQGIAQGVGQVGAMALTSGAGQAIGLGAKGITALTTGFTGLSSMGSGRSEAYLQGAADEESRIYGAIKGVADAGTELLFGGMGKSINALGYGKGISSADDMLAKKLSSKMTDILSKNIKISDKALTIAGNTIEFGVKSSAEGVEEVLAGFITALGKKATYMSEEDFGKLIEDENLLEQFVVGSLTSGIVQSGVIPKTRQGSFIEANQKGVDLITGYTRSEQELFDKIVEKQIAEAEKDGKKISEKDKNSIKEQVLTMFERGELDIDTIEEHFGGDEYKVFQSLVKEAEEYDTLNKTKGGELTGEQSDRLAELKAKNTEKSYSNQLLEARGKLSETVRKNTANNSFIQNSFAELGKRRESYKVDATKKYSAKEMETIQRAVDYGALNNTRRTHEFVDLVAKLSADKGVSFDFTNNQKLKDSGFAIEGKTINGFKQGNNIVINMQSKNNFNTVVGHEITHVLEGTELYQSLQDTVIQYAKDIGVYDAKYKDIVHLYRKQFEGNSTVDRKALYDSEITADLVGEYIFSDVDFVRNLSTKNRNVFEKVYDEIKYFLKVVTTGSDAEKQLLKAKKIFEDVYRDTKKNTSENTQLSAADNKGRTLTKEQQEPFHPEQIKNVDNVNPTDNPDIRYSLTDNSKGIAPIKNGIYEEDVAIDESTDYYSDQFRDVAKKVENVAPIKEKLQEDEENLEEGIAPIQEVAQTEAPAQEEIAPIPDEPIEGTQLKFDDTTGDIVDDIEPENKVYRKARKEVKEALIGDKATILTKALDNAKNRAVALLNNTDTIRVNELVFGREAGRVINDFLFQKAIDNESKSIAWQNKERKDIKALGIKPKSKESEAVQKYGEKQWEDSNGVMHTYGDFELAVDFPNVKTQEKIKNASKVLREKYDKYIDEANAVLTELGFNPIQKRADYMRHFEALTDAFSRMGIPFNVQQIQEYDLPTDINGLTDTFVPQKSYFANIMQRKGNQTTFDAITGIDGYIGGISNLIFHTEDIQRGRAFEEMIRERYGRSNAEETLKNIESDTDRQRRLKRIQENHLSGYASWVRDWTNNLAGKKDISDRGFEHRIGRRVYSFFDTLRKQVGANMIGFNISSSLTNLIAPVQSLAKTNKVAFAKGSVDTIRNIFKKDGFVEQNSFLTARMGTDKLSKTFWEKWQDTGFMFMRGMDYFTSNLVVRGKYHELIDKGMSPEQAHIEAGKFGARIMGDRTKGANAQLFNSKFFNMFAQFQLEVNNQVYSMFYDTYHESVEKSNGNVAKATAGVMFTLGQLFGFTHIFGQAFEKLAGYNPTLDIISIIATALGVGDDDEEEKPIEERLEDATLQLLKGLPYISTLVNGGRVPMANALPLTELITGEKDGYEVSRTDTVMGALPYYLLPAGYGQMKKAKQGLGMFDEDLPVSGSYTKSGNLRYPVEDTLQNKIKAGVFGQYAFEEANDYFDNERLPLKEKQIQEYKDLNLPIKEYWAYREGLKEQETVEEKFEYIANLDLPVSKKNIMINNEFAERKQKIDLTNYDDFSDYDEFDWYSKNTEKYNFLEENGVSYSEYKADEKMKTQYDNDFEWYKKNPNKVTFSKAITDNVIEYKDYMRALDDISADKDKNGKSISGSRKNKVIDYVNSLNLSIPQKAMLIRQEYSTFTEYNNQIVEYVGGLNIEYEDKITILEELEMKVDEYGNVTWK